RVMNIILHTLSGGNGHLGLLERALSGGLEALPHALGVAVSRGLGAGAAWLGKGLGAAQMLVQQTEPAPPTALPDPPKVPDSPFFWMPNGASEFSGRVDGLFDFLLWTSTVSLIGIAAAMIYFC